MAEVKEAILDWIKRWQNPGGVPRTRPGLSVKELTQEEIYAKELEQEQAPTATAAQQLEILKRPITPRPKK